MVAEETYSISNSLLSRRAHRFEALPALIYSTRMYMRNYQVINDKYTYSHTGCRHVDQPSCLNQNKYIYYKYMDKEVDSSCQEHVQTHDKI